MSAVYGRARERSVMASRDGKRAIAAAKGKGGGLVQVRPSNYPILSLPSGFPSLAPSTSRRQS